MPSVEARLVTDRPSRYLQQFCRHAAAMGDAPGRTHHGQAHAPDRSILSAQADWSESYGVVTFAASGRCTLTAGDGALTVRIDADDADSLRSIKRVVSDDFARFGRREKVVLDWRECS